MSDVRSEATFLERYARGEVAEQQIDDFISAWHDGDGEGLSLHEYLGFTWPEYQEWVMESGALARILARRRADGGQPAS